MSARSAIQAALAAQLRAAPGLAGLCVFDAPPVRAALPYLHIDEPVLTDWGTKSWTGAEARLTLLIHDGGERPVRLRGLADAAEAAALSLPPDLGDGWQLATITLLRSRIGRAGDRWIAASELRARAYRAS